MFHDMPQPILDRMVYLEAIDAQDRTNGTPRPQRLRQIPPETGKFLALLAADNTISHQEDLEPFLQRVYHDRRVDSVNVPIGKGVLVCRRNGGV